MTEATVIKYVVVGRSYECDVFIDSDDVSPKHAILQCTSNSFLLAPQDGKVGFTGVEGKVRWSNKPHEIRPHDTLWLTSNIRMPWPVAEEAVAVLSLGRAIDCDIVIDDPSVSGKHGVLIVGPSRSVVLLDYGSLNGVFFESNGCHRVKGVLLRSGMNLLLGTHRVAATDLLKSVSSKLSAKMKGPGVATGIPKDALVVAETFSGETNHERTSWQTKQYVAGATVAAFIACLIIIIIAYSRTGEYAAVSSKGLSSEFSSAPVSAGTAPSAQSIKEVEGLHQVEPVRWDPKQNVFWVTLRHRNSGVRYRLGSGVAVESKIILTTGSVIVSAQNMLSNGYEDLSVVSVDGKIDKQVLNVNVWDVFTKRAQRAADLSASHDRLTIEDVDQSLVQESLQSINLAYAAASAVDLGWLEVDQLSMHAELAKAVEYWPRRAVKVFSTGFDSEDPRMPISTSVQREASATTFRVLRMASGLEGLDGAITLIGLADSPENWIGSPLLSGSRLEGLVTYQSNTQPEDAPEQESSITLEIVSAETIRAMLESRTPSP